MEAKAARILLAGMMLCASASPCSTAAHGGHLARASATAPAVEPSSPLPYVQPGSRWLYRSNFGQALVRLDGGEAQRGQRSYRWEIRLLGVGMQEELILTEAGLFTASRHFLLPIGRAYAMAFDPAEPTIPLPLEVGRRWTATTEARSGSDAGSARVSGEVQAFTTVEVPAGLFQAFRIHLLRQDSWGALMDATIWLDPSCGVVRAVGDLRWPGVVGSVQQALGLHHLELELVEATVRALEGPIGVP